MFSALASREGQLQANAPILDLGVKTEHSMIRMFNIATFSNQTQKCKMVVKILWSLINDMLKYDFDWTAAFQITNLGTRQSKLNLTWSHLKQKIPIIFTKSSLHVLLVI